MKFFKTLSSFILCFSTSIHAVDLPILSEVSHGDVALSLSDDYLKISQTTEQSIIEWHKYDLPAEHIIEYLMSYFKYFHL